MASLKRIDEMVEYLESMGLPTTPEWMKGVKINVCRTRPSDSAVKGTTLYPTEEIDDRFDYTCQVSGQLRECDSWFFDSDPALCVFLSEAAERLDDAHEEWLEQRMRLIAGWVPE